VTTFYGLADYSVQEVVEFFASREEAEKTLQDVLHDEPQWESILGLVRVELGYDEARVEKLESSAAGRPRRARYPVR
jgi:hypothetical protein